ADHAGCQDTRRSTSGSIQLLGDRLVSWSSKRQKSVAISSTEAEYTALSGCLSPKSCILPDVLRHVSYQQHLQMRIMLVGKIHAIAHLVVYNFWVIDL
ncbi:retrovirus-related pol polyprotein from transposon TNT 1-94, partial [Tanacetum coccineum]